MKSLVPYKNIKSVHLPVVITFARGLLLLSVFFTIGLILGVILGPFWGYSAMYFIGLLSLPVAGFVLSSALAALVAFEEGFRQRTEQLVDRGHDPT